MMNEIQNLLTNIGLIVNKHHDLAKITGANFNIFSVMRAEHDEVRTHSRIIGELLNPRGSHGQGSIFLKLFFRTIDPIKDEVNFDFENAKVKVEEHIGFISEDYESGGYIDIVIKDNSNQIVIENKIYAQDQTKQLYRYKNYYKDCFLLYLTLDGCEPSIESTNGLKLDADYHCISYAKNIIEWLESCLKEVVNKSIIRETLNQYICLIKKLTNQSTNDNLSEEIVNFIIENNKNIKYAFEIGKNIEKIKLAICKIFIDKVVEHTGLVSKKFDDVPIGKCDSGIWFQVEKTEIGILLYFESEFGSLNLCVDFYNQKKII